MFCVYEMESEKSQENVVPEATSEKLDNIDSVSKYANNTQIYLKTRAGSSSNVPPLVEQK